MTNNTTTTPDWYGIDGILFHFMGPWDDPEITYNGIRDNSGVIVEATMWERYVEDRTDNQLTSDPGEPFARYMRDNADEVKYLIEVARGLEV